MIEEPASGLPDESAAPLESQAQIDLVALIDLEFNYSPEYRFKLDYRHDGPVWTAMPSDGGDHLTGGTDRELRAKLRQAKPVRRP